MDDNRAGVIGIRRLSDDPDDFYASVSPYVGKMGAVAARFVGIQERDDVVQHALLQAWRHRSQFNPIKGELATWLVAITAHEAGRLGRRLRRRVPAFAPSTDGRGESHLELASALRKLTPRERLAIDCYYFVGLSVAETAVVMKCSEGTVKSTLAPGRLRLRNELRSG